jgi:hypothetical protein
LSCGSGKDALAAVVVVVAVVIVVALVVVVVDAATKEPPPLTYSHYLTVSGESVPLVVLPITTDRHIYLSPAQHEALRLGAYTRAMIRPAAWEGAGPSPTQAVALAWIQDVLHLTPARP